MTSWRPSKLLLVTEPPVAPYRPCFFVRTDYKPFFSTRVTGRGFVARVTDRDFVARVADRFSRTAYRSTAVGL